MYLLQEITPDMIDSIAGLWKLAAIIMILIMLIIFRHPISIWLLKVSRVSVKKGDTEFMVEGDSEPQDQVIDNLGDELVKPEDPDQPFRADQLLEQKDTYDWYGSMVKAFIDNDLDKADDAYNNLIASEIDAVKKLQWEVIYHQCRYDISNKRDGLKELERLTEEKEIRSFALQTLAYCYKKSRSYDKAIKSLELSIEASQNLDERINGIKSLSEVYIEIADYNKAFEIVLREISGQPPSNRTGDLFKILAEIYENNNELLLQSIVLEMALNFDPEDSSLRFNAAYVQSEAKLSHLSVTNWETLLRQNPEDNRAQNNLGVESSRLDLPIRAVQYYVASSKSENSLAMANLAYLYMNNGFTDEASEILKTAQTKDNVHPNVSDAISSISKRNERENNRWDEIIQSGVKHQLFIKSFAQARFLSKPRPGSFDGNWKYNDQEIQIEETDDRFEAEWGENSSKRFLQGDVTNVSAQVVLKKWHPLKLGAEDRGYYDSGNSGFAYVSDNADELHILILDKDNNVFLDLVRQDQIQNEIDITQEV